MEASQSAWGRRGVDFVQASPWQFRDRGIGGSLFEDGDGVAEHADRLVKHGQCGRRVYDGLRLELKVGPPLMLPLLVGLPWLRDAHPVRAGQSISHDEARTEGKEMFALPHSSESHLRSTNGKRGDPEAAVV